MIFVVCIESENSANIGSIARAMANFGLSKLVLVNPKVSHTEAAAMNLAAHAKQILKSAVVTDKGFLDTLDIRIATTAKLGTDYNIPRSPITPEQMAKALKGQKGRIGILIGRDGSGLNNEEILSSDFVVTIPASKAYPTLNISHAAAILFYELFKNAPQKEQVSGHILPATKKEKQVLLQTVEQLLKKTRFATEQKRDTQRRVWKRIIGKSMLTKREAFALIGFLKKL